ncbi:carbonic anhydrase 15-like [Brachyhypopomus gauderio]|uniref:carbonic anhydrase 15-like n=1 Tax=Brachyhypopomus gauderio TaxID=698409 RepID=UPI0040434586
MKMKLLAFLFACLLPNVKGEGSSANWCYNLPTCNFYTWPTISPHFCNGSQQSPVDIVTRNVVINASLVPFTYSGFNDGSALQEITNSEGKTVKISVNDSKVNVSGGGLTDLYKTSQVHFHWGNGSSTGGSEHTVDSRQYQMELHIVNYKASYGNLTAALGDPTGVAVFGFFIEATNDSGNPGSWNNLTSFLSSIPSNGNSKNIGGQLALEDLLLGVNRTKYYRYSGSLTTPSCNEAVVWTIFKDTIKVSKDLIDLFSTTVRINTTSDSLMTYNFRGGQQLNGRIITSQTSSATTPHHSTFISAVLLAAGLWWFC